MNDPKPNIPFEHVALFTHDLSNALVRVQRRVQKLSNQSDREDDSTVDSIEEALDDCICMISAFKKTITPPN